MRKEFGRFMADIAGKDKDIALIVGDIGFSIFDEFRQRFPDRFFNVGICEQSMIGVAAGMALEGLKPYVYTITPFLIERPFEQIKIDIDQQEANVKLVGYADYPTHGPTHRELDARALMGLLKNTELYFPRNSAEARSNLLDSYEHRKPAFINLTRNPSK